MHAVQVPLQSTVYLHPVSDIQILTVRDADVCPSPQAVDSATFASESTGSLMISVDDTENGLECITQLMRQHLGVVHLDLMLKAQEEGLYLGGFCLSADTLERYAWDLQDWFAGANTSTMGDRPRICIYVKGVRDIKQLNHVTRMLSQFTGADIRIFNL